MILQALVSCYEALAAKGKLERPGWLEVKVSWSLELNADGTLRQIVPLGLPDKKGKTTVTAMKLPAMEKRSPSRRTVSRTLSPCQMKIPNCISNLRWSIRPF